MWHPVHAIFATVSGLFRKGSWSSCEKAPGRRLNSSLPIALLCLVGDEDDRVVIADLCLQNRWEVFFAKGQNEARHALDRLKPQIILFDRDLGGEDWRELMTRFAASSGGACIILMSKVLDDHLWNEVVCNGGYEVLGKPLRADEVFRTVRLAWSYWNSANKWAAGSKR
jgi:DNA-binding NtrC family response regulator